MTSNKLLAALFSAVAYGLVTSHAASAIDIDIAQYMTDVPSDIAICSAGDVSKRSCISQYYNNNKEWTLIYTLGNPADSSNPKIIDYMARSSHTPYYFGVVRNFDRTGGSILFRCVGLANPARACQAAPSPQFLPENVPLRLDANQASAPAVLATEDSSTGAPKTTIPGATFIAGDGFRSLAVNSMDPSSCRQQVGNEIAIRVSAILVAGYPFGGDIGDRDALIIDEEESASSNGVAAPHPTHLERYYYVPGYGRVKEGSSNYDPKTGLYDLFHTGASLRNVVVKPNPVPSPPIMCPQTPQ